MSYDLMIFEPAVAPGDRVGFLAWYNGVVRMTEGQLVNNPQAASARLQGWYREMIRPFPPISGPDAGRFDTPDESRLTEYRFGANVIIAGFGWDASRAACDKAMKVARAHGLGFFNVSSEDAAVWTPTPDGRYLIAHRNERVAV